MVHRNGFQDLEWLERGYSELVVLSVNEPNIESIAPLMNCKNLTVVALNGPHITDLSPLLSCNNLKRILLVRSAVTDLEPLMIKPDLVVEGNLSGVPPEQRAFFEERKRLRDQKLENVSALI